MKRRKANLVAVVVEAVRLPRGVGRVVVVVAVLLLLVVGQVAEAVLLYNMHLSAIRI